jgi:hypothetical protein
VNAVLRLDLGWGSLVNSFGYLNAQNDTTTDLSSVYVPLLPLLGFPNGFITSVGLGSTSNIDVYTDEIRLASNPGGVLDWTVGLYGRQLDRDGISRTTTALAALPSISSRPVPRASPRHGRLSVSWRGRPLIGSL